MENKDKVPRSENMAPPGQDCARRQGADEGNVPLHTTPDAGQLECGDHHWQPGRELPPGAQKPPEHNVFDLIYGVLFDPVRTWARVAQNPPVATAAIIFIVTSLLVGLSGIFATPLYQSLAVGDGFGWGRVVLPLLFVVSLTVSVIMWFLMSGLLHLVAELLGGQGRAKGVFTVYALSNLPSMVVIPFNIVIAVFLSGTFSSALASLLIFAAFIWSVVLIILGIGQVHGLSTSKATIVVIAPPLILLVGFIVMLLIVLTSVPAVAPTGPYWKIF